MTTLNAAVEQLTSDEKSSGDVLDDFALLYEQIISKATTQEVSGTDIVIDEEAIAAGVSIAGLAKESTEKLLKDNRVSLLREVRKDIAFHSHESDVTFNIELPSVGYNSDGSATVASYEGITLKTDFAAVRIDTEKSSNMKVRIQGLNQDQLVGLTTEGLEPPVQSGIPWTQFWSIPVIVIFLLVWMLNGALRQALKVWVVPAVCFLMLLGNMFSMLSYINSTFATAGIAGDSFATDLPIVAVRLDIEPNEQVILCIPTGDSGTDFSAVFNERNEQMLSKYNPLTRQINSWVYEDGVYSLKNNSISYTDIDDAHDVMKDAILRLGSRGIMPGSNDGRFKPEDEITRAEFVAAVLNAFNLLDETATSSFTDVKKSDWFYSAVATAQQLNFISGFEDGTFRGNNDIPKDQMVVVCANSMITYMGYIRPGDITDQLRNFQDKDDIAGWASEGIALAAKSSMLLYRSDGKFLPAEPITRGDAAIILDKMFSKIW
jgi:hypothetical protein